MEHDAHMRSEALNKGAAPGIFFHIDKHVLRGEQ